MNALSSHAGAVTPNAYKYNSGTELTEDLDVDYYETYFRQYDAQTGRFTGVDLLSEATFNFSPYHYAANDPIYFNDPSGLSKIAEGGGGGDWDFSDYWNNRLGHIFDDYPDIPAYGGDEGGGSPSGGGGGSSNTYQHGGSGVHQLIGSRGALGGEDATPNMNKASGRIDISHLQGKSNEELLDNMRSLFRFYSLGDLETAGQEFVDRFALNMSGKYINLLLNNAILKNDAFTNFENKVKQNFIDKIKEKKGDISDFNIDLPPLPYFDEKFSGLGIIVHGVQKGDIYLNNFSLDANGNFSATLNIQLFDDFGLSNGDVMNFQNKTFVPHLDGLKSWWILQNQRGFSPFVTTMSFLFTFHGTIP